MEGLQEERLTLAERGKIDVFKINDDDDIGCHLDFLKCFTYFVWDRSNISIKDIGK